MSSFLETWQFWKFVNNEISANQFAPRSVKYCITVINLVLIFSPSLSQLPPHLQLRSSTRLLQPPLANFRFFQHQFFPRPLLLSSCSRKYQEKGVRCYNNRKSSISDLKWRQQWRFYFICSNWLCSQEPTAEPFQMDPVHRFPTCIYFYAPTV